MRPTLLRNTYELAIAVTLALGVATPSAAGPLPGAVVSLGKGVTSPVMVVRSSKGIGIGIGLIAGVVGGALLLSMPNLMPSSTQASAATPQADTTPDDGEPPQCGGGPDNDRAQGHGAPC
jgi:hypothetical protein